MIYPAQRPGETVATLDPVTVHHGGAWHNHSHSQENAMEITGNISVTGSGVRLRALELSVSTSPNPASTERIVERAAAFEKYITGDSAAK